MSYIIFVQPAVMSTTEMDFDAVFAATCLITAFSTLLMAFMANYPIAVAPAMGHNFFFVFTVVGSMGFTWQLALGAVFISGVLFLAMSLWGLRETLVRAIPASLKHGIAVGIGLLITLVGLEWSGIVAANPATLVTRHYSFSPQFYFVGSVSASRAIPFWEAKACPTWHNSSAIVNGLSKSRSSCRKYERAVGSPDMNKTCSEEWHRTPVRANCGPLT